MKPRPVARRIRQRGVAIVEFALILPFLLMLSLAIAEIGRVVMHYSVLTQAVREAARYLSVQTPDQGLEAARQIVLYGRPGGTQFQLPYLSEAQVIERSFVAEGSNPPVILVRLTVKGYTYRSLFSSVAGVDFGNLVFKDISASMRVESCGTLC